VINLGRSFAEAVGIAGIKKMVNRKVIVKRVQKDFFIFRLLVRLRVERGPSFTRVCRHHLLLRVRIDMQYHKSFSSLRTAQTWKVSLMQVLPIKITGFIRNRFSIDMRKLINFIIKS